MDARFAMHGRSTHTQTSHICKNCIILPVEETKEESAKNDYIFHTDTSQARKYENE